jgi:hypothetical protein
MRAATWDGSEVALLRNSEPQTGISAGACAGSVGPFCSTRETYRPRNVPPCLRERIVRSGGVR